MEFEITNNPILLLSLTDKKIGIMLINCQYLKTTYTDMKAVICLKENNDGN